MILFYAINYVKKITTVVSYDIDMYIFIYCNFT